MLTTRPERMRFADAPRRRPPQNRISDIVTKPCLPANAAAIMLQCRRRHAVVLKEPPARRSAGAPSASGRDRLVCRGHDSGLRHRRVATSGRLAAAVPLHSRPHAVPLLLVAPLPLYMVAFYALPLASMLLRSVADPAWTLENYAALAG